MSLNPKTKLGTYEILSPLGAGGMGEVHRARDARLDREVAIKVLPDSFASDPERIARFQREAKVLASLNHPNIAAIYGFEESEGTHFLVLELVEGETLADRLKARKMTMGESLEVARQIAEALEAAHEKGIIHRDLKPANVKITPEGKVKVLDFGLAKPVSSGPSAGAAANPLTITAEHTREGAVLGTAAYMSPEQARGRPLDKRTDVWSFGCLLYECLTGVRPFDGQTTSDVVAKILERAPDFSLLPGDTPPPMRKLLHRCLEKECMQRLRDIGEARITIDELQAGPIATPAPPVVVVSRLGGLRRGLPWGIAALTTAIACAAVWRGTRPDEPEQGNWYLVTPTTLAPYSRIRAELLKPREWSKAEKMPEEYFLSEQGTLLNGRFVRHRIEQGEPITEESLWPVAVSSLLMAKLGNDPTMRGVPVEVDEVSGGGGFVKPGTTVDLMAVGDLPNNLRSKRFLEAVIVLAVNTRDSGRPSGQQKQAKGRRTRRERLSHVVLLLSPGEAERVKALESERGIKIQLLLTGHDSRSVQTDGATVFDALGITERDEPEHGNWYLIAPTTLTPYSRIRAELLKAQEWTKAEKMPKEYIPPEQGARLNGRFVRNQIVQGVPITEESFWPDAVTSLMAAKLADDPTMRGVAVKVDEVSAGGGSVKPGDSVDLMAVGDLPNNLRAKRFLEDVIVLAVNMRDTARPNDPRQQAEGKRSRPEQLSHVILLLSPNEAVRVKAVESDSTIKIQLLLTGADAPRVQTDGTTIFDALGIAERDEPAKEAPPSPDPQD